MGGLFPLPNLLISYIFKSWDNNIFIVELLLYKFSNILNMDSFKTKDVSIVFLECTFLTPLIFIISIWTCERQTRLPEMSLSFWKYTIYCSVNLLREVLIILYTCLFLCTQGSPAFGSPYLHSHLSSLKLICTHSLFSVNRLTFPTKSSEMSVEFVSTLHPSEISILYWGWGSKALNCKFFIFMFG